MKRKFCDGVFDLLHEGHIKHFQYLKGLYQDVHLLIGVMDDDAATHYKRKPFHNMTHRAEMVASCKYVDEIIENYPYIMNNEFMDTHNIDIVAHAFSDENDIEKQDKTIKHLKNIFFNYKKSPFFDELYPKIERLYQQDFDLFSDLAYQHLLFWLSELHIETKIIKSSSLDINSKKSDLILDLCSEFDADKYISGALGSGYLDEGDFKKKDIEVEYQNYQHPQYTQLHGDFLPNMSVVDFCMNSNEVKLI